MPRSTSRFSLGGRLTPVVTWLIGLLVATFLVITLSGIDAQLTILRWILLTPESLQRAEVWKLVTTTFVSLKPIGFLLDVLVLWMFVPTLEGAWGPKRFLKFFFLTSIIGNLVAAVSGLWFGHTAINSMAPFLYGAIAAFGVQWGDAPVQFFGVLPMKGKVLAIGVSVIMLISTAVNNEWALFLGYAAAMGAAVAFAGEPSLWLLRLRRFRLANDKKKAMRRYTVLNGGKPKDGPGGKSEGDAEKDKRWLN